jgi:predicted component of type VI protein secretion system
MIQITCDREVVKKYEIKDNDVFIIGRNNDCDIVLDYPTVSRKHLKVTMEKGKIYITDLKSANGTYFNKNKIDHDIKLEMRNYDKITLGDCEEKIRFLTSSISKPTREKEKEFYSKKRHRSRSYSKDDLNGRYNRNTKHINNEKSLPKVENQVKILKPNFITEDNLIDYNLNKENEDLIREFLIIRKDYDVKEIYDFKNNLKTLQ